MLVTLEYLFLYRLVFSSQNIFLFNVHDIKDLKRENKTITQQIKNETNTINTYLPVDIRYEKKRG